MQYDQNKKEWIRLAFSENVGPITFKNLIAYFGSAKEALDHINDFARRGGRTKPITLASEQFVEEQLDMAYQNGCEIYTTDDHDYPPQLKQIEDAPPVLFIKGHSFLMKKQSVAMVGTRNASLNGRSFTRRIALDLCQQNYVITSGMAKGIDTASHEGALASTNENGGTIAVVGTPLNEIYPLENTNLFYEICERGCAVSELPFGTPTAPQNFPRRNRIISGLAKGVIVIEAQEHSGSLITAKIAKEQHKPLFAVPGFPLDPRSAGPNKLIKNGAYLTENAHDILNVLEGLTQQTLFSEPSYRSLTPTPTIMETELDSARTIVINSLSPQTTSVDELIRGTDLSSQIVNIILTELELAGRIERHPGNRISLLFD